MHDRTKNQGVSGKKSTGRWIGFGARWAKGKASRVRAATGQANGKASQVKSGDRPAKAIGRTDKATGSMAKSIARCDKFADRFTKSTDRYAKLTGRPNNPRGSSVKSAARPAKSSGRSGNPDSSRISFDREPREIRERRINFRVVRVFRGQAPACFFAWSESCFSSSAMRCSISLRSARCSSISIFGNMDSA